MRFISMAIFDSDVVSFPGLGIFLRSFFLRHLCCAQITNTDKIKKMSRKQLRLVRKMDTNPSAAKHATKNSKMK
jgi:hypothetical protein